MKRHILIICFFSLFTAISSNVEHKFVELKKFNALEARQGIAVDEKYIYVIDSRQIGKYDKETNELVAHWQEEENGQIVHLNSGVVVDGKLYCAHSNYPGIPMTSSVEIWDTETLQHIGTHSFGIQKGSCTWVDRHNGFWWVAFAHYEKWKSATGKGTEWTTVIKFDDQWRDLQTWVFPQEVIEKFRPMSNSGGSWGTNGLLYCTGHNLPELYALRIPPKGSVLELIETFQINIEGQGIAWDRSKEGFIYGIKKNDKEVMVFKYVDTY